MLIEAIEEGKRINLNSQTKLPYASAFLWNNSLMIHLNCRGYAVAQFMQPEPAKYAHAPNLEAKTFIQPERPFYTHHPGRFCYIKDEDTQELFSVPYEPVRATPEKFIFSAGKSNIKWEILQDGIFVEMTLSLPKDDPLELWSINIRNDSSHSRNLSVYPYFPVGYMSWMNQSGEYDPSLQAIVCSSISPYQKYHDYEKIKELKDKTFLMADKEPVSWEVNQQAFEGEGGLHNPTAIRSKLLEKGDARYEMPACVFQFREKLKPQERKGVRFIFGPAKDQQEFKNIRHKYFIEKNINRIDGFDQALHDYEKYIEDGKPCIQIKTPDKEMDNFINQWLSRQVFYHGLTNRLCTDPQTRNYLQDNMGMSYIMPEIAKNAFVNALSQQKGDGEMPDGILIHEDAKLKYINQVPHSDHCVWLPICIQAYLDETNDYAMMNERVAFSDGEDRATISEHIHRAMIWLSENVDERGLSYINQGDWNDPMNMVGYKGKGVSGWLSMATSYGLQVWATICEQMGDHENAQKFRSIAADFNDAINKHLWDGDWYARGITDDNVVFGVKDDKEGQIFLNTQSWALLCGCADESKIKRMIASIEARLETKYGVELVSPAYTAMREDVGRLTQKHPGYAENGSVYNHAVAFYIYGLYSTGENDRAYRLLRKMIPGPDEEDILQRGQLPVFIPNYYRGAFSLFPKKAGRSSQLFNTGTVHWYYRSLIDGLFGLRGCSDGLQINPGIPSDWNEAAVKRFFRGAEFDVHYTREKDIDVMEIEVDDQKIENQVIKNIQRGKLYKVTVKIPF